MILIKGLSILLSGLLILLPSCKTISIDKTGNGFNHPSGVIVNMKSGSYYVSNYTGDKTAKDNSGFISLLDNEGDIIRKKFIKGSEKIFLNAPRGMTIVGNILYVADIDAVRGFALTTGFNEYNVDLFIPVGARSLYDIIGDEEGNLYVSDTAENAIHKIYTKDNNRVIVYI